MDKATFNKIIDKIQKGTASGKELSLYNSYLNRLTNSTHQTDNIPNSNVKRVLWARIKKEINPVKQPLIKWQRLITNVAAVLLIVAIGAYFLIRPGHHTNKPRHTSTIKNDALPAKNKAFLTLANGQKIILADAKNGTLVSQADMQIHKKTDGELVYSASKNTQTNILTYNTLTTPQGGIYRVVLSDGTKVWLNASSILRFPEVFGSTERKVELIAGEAYFEVAHHAKIPFKVISPKGIIEDIGTTFNVNAYPENANQITTLIEGVLSVSYRHQKITLKPGQQALLANRQHSTSIKLTNADLEETLAWKNGLFLFNDESLESIMQKVAHWYNVKVIFKNEAIKQKSFIGVISRFKNASEVMKMLEKTGNIQFSIIDNQIIIQ